MTSERLWTGYPIYRSEWGTFLIATPVTYHKFDSYSQGILCANQHGPEVHSPKVNEDSRATWVGHLKCFPDQTPLNQAAKSQLLESHDPESFWVTIQNGENAHLAPLVIVINEECQIPCYPRVRCCETYAESKKPKQSELFT